jgi:hypothetical protein
MAWKSGVDYAKPKVMLRAWAKEYRDSIRVVPLLHDSPFFVDLGSMLLTTLLVLAYYYSLKAFVWPRDGCEADEVVDQPVATDKNADKKKQEDKKQQKEKVEDKKQNAGVPAKSGSTPNSSSSSRKQGETKKGAAAGGATPSKSSKKNN